MWVIVVDKSIFATKYTVFFISLKHRCCNAEVIRKNVTNRQWISSESLTTATVLQTPSFRPQAWVQCLQGCVCSVVWHMPLITCCSASQGEGLSVGTVVPLCKHWSHWCDINLHSTCLCFEISCYILRYLLNVVFFSIEFNEKKTHYVIITLVRWLLISLFQ